MGIVLTGGGGRREAEGGAEFSGYALADVWVAVC